MEKSTSDRSFNSQERKSLFLQMASKSGGVTPADVYQAAVGQGDRATEEAYYNIARRLLHRGVLLASEKQGSTYYTVGVSAESEWLEEDDLSALIDPDYPLLALTIWKESTRQVNEIADSVWIELRERLKNCPARSLFHQAIISYCDDLHAQVSDLINIQFETAAEASASRQEADNARQLLLQLTKFGLGLSTEAVRIPQNLDQAIELVKSGQVKSFTDPVQLKVELEDRISDEMFITPVAEQSTAPAMLIGAVDGSSRGGILSFVGEEGDVSIGHAPMTTINTAVGQVNRATKKEGRLSPIFMRLPEKPEDMQRQDNRYTVMAKVLYPDLGDAEYVHSIWNAMDLIEAKATLRIMSRWYTAKENAEIPPADVVLRDGTVSPQDRDFYHYGQLNSYGKIVRDLIETNWKVALTCRENAQTVAGVVKHSELRIFVPIINWFASRTAAEGKGQLLTWPQKTMNLISDQSFLTRLLTAGRKKNDIWTRTCVVLRPFHSLTNFARSHSSSGVPSEPIRQMYRDAMSNPDRLEQEKKAFWETLFNLERDPYVKMIDLVSYGSFFLAAVPRLDNEKSLPRFELLCTKDGSSDVWKRVYYHLDRALLAVRQTGFDVSAEHTMFNSPARLDILPAMLIRVHDTVKYWAAELLSRVQEFVGYYLAKHVKNKKFKGIKVRPFTRGELELLYGQLKAERHRQAGDAPKDDPMLEK